MFFRKKIEDDSDPDDFIWGEDYSWVRVLYFDRWFRILGLVLAAAGAALLIAIPKFWTSSLPGIQPAVKISLLDKVQAARALHLFEAAAATNRTEAAMRWLSRAHAYNSGSPVPSEKCLDWYATHPHPGLQTDQWLAGEASILLQLTLTNASAAHHIAAAFAEVENDPIALDALYPINALLNPPERVRLLRACLFLGRMDLFDETVAAGVDSSVPEVRLAKQIRNATLPGHKNAAGTIAEFRNSAAALKSPKIAARFLLSAGIAEGNSDACLEALERLRDLHALAVTDEIKYWNHLLAMNHRDEALALARKRLATGGDAPEAETLVRAAASMGLYDESLDFLEHELSLDAQNSNLRLLQAGILMACGRWKDLTESAIKLRNALANDLARSIGYLLEATAAAEQDLDVAARQSLARVNPHGLRPPRLVIDCARRLAEHGLAKESLNLLISLKDDYAEDPGFWTALQFAAFRNNDIDALVDNAAQAYRHWPEKDAITSAYASALVLARRDPETAARLTKELIKKLPDSKVARLSHAMALVQLQQWPQAAIELTWAEGQRDTAEYQTLAQLTRFEYLLGSGDLARAEAVSRQIAITNLPAFQRVWFTKARQKLASAEKAESVPVK